jgi:hypothetical protein
LYQRILALIAAVLVTLAPLGSGLVRADEEDETPRIADFLETRVYTQASTRQVLGQFDYVIGEVDRFPAAPSPEFVDKNNLRKRLLDLRLMMDFNAFAYPQGSIIRYRDMVDEAYEAVGVYKDLNEVNAKIGLPIDPSDRDRRFNAMLNALGPLRQADVRDKFRKAYDPAQNQIVLLEFDSRPRIWQIARIEPTDTLDSAGNAARLGQAVLWNLRYEGLVVGDIFDPVQEMRFHDVRKALRSVLVLTDSFPSVADSLVDVREPLADLVKAYGKANEQIVAYRVAQDTGLDLEPRAAALTKAFDKAQDLAREFDESGQLDSFVSALAGSEASHLR